MALPAVTSETEPVLISGEEALYRYMRDHSDFQLRNNSTENYRVSAYQALLDGPIRCAWVRWFHLLNMLTLILTKC